MDTSDLRLEFKNPIKNHSGFHCYLGIENILLPLYQKKGSEGFYIIKIIPTFWLRFASFLRRINLDSVLLALPGITRYEKGVKTLKVNVWIIRYLPVELLHLLGYRRVRREGFNLLFIKRETIKYLS